MTTSPAIVAMSERRETREREPLSGILTTGGKSIRGASAERSDGGPARRAGAARRRSAVGIDEDADHRAATAPGPATAARRLACSEQASEDAALRRRRRRRGPGAGRPR